MPCIGIIRGSGEGYVATELIIKLIKGLRRRFRSKLDFAEINQIHSTDDVQKIDPQSLLEIKNCDVVYAGDMEYNSESYECTIEDVAMAFMCNVHYKCISGIGNHANVNVRLAAYFDGGHRFRDGKRTKDGCFETKVCSEYSAKNIVRHICRECENRRRRLAFVKNNENEYCADMFRAKFESYTLPLTNFQFLKFSVSDIAYEMMYDAKQFDTVFASEGFSEFADGVYKAIMADDYAGYDRYDGEKRIYYPRGLYGNSPSSDAVPSICSYIVSFCDVLEEVFDMKKESTQLRLALDAVIQKGISVMSGEIFTDAILEELKKPVSTRFVKTPKNRYIIK